MLKQYESLLFSVFLLEVRKKARPSWYRSTTKSAEPQAPSSCSAIFNHGFHPQSHLEDQNSNSNSFSLQARNRRVRDEEKMKHFQVEEFPFKYPSQYSRQYLYIRLITEFIEGTLSRIHFVTPGHS